jgi:L-seryl-tRNA(Ser) seleniumtransferase
VIALNTLASGREAVLSRGELVEIGGSFRMPDVFRAAGVRLREVGTTNRTRLSDYAGAVGTETGLLLRVHPSNYRIVGFTESVEIAELVALGRERGVPVMDDLGAGALVPIPPEPEIARSVEAGADLITCSGDKLIGGPQSGIVLGRKSWVDRVRANPLFRALRVDKMTLCALERTLRLFLRAGGPGEEHPTLRMLARSAESLAREARNLKARIARAIPSLETSLLPGFSQVGSGSLPGERLPTTLVAIAKAGTGATALARALRRGDPPVYPRIVDDRVCLDPRTILPGDDRLLLEALKGIA